MEQLERKMPNEPLACAASCHSLRRGALAYQDCVAASMRSPFIPHCDVTCGVRSVFLVWSQVTLIKAMLRAGADVNAQDHGGLTAAMHAAKMCNSAVVVMLIQEANADLTLRCKEGKTALDHAGDQPTIDTLSENSIFLQAHGKEFI